jgi:hypothetical protein
MRVAVLNISNNSLFWRSLTSMPGKARFASYIHLFRATVGRDEPIRDPREIINGTFYVLARSLAAEKGEQ